MSSSTFMYAVIGLFVGTILGASAGKDEILLSAIIGAIIGIIGAQIDER